MLIAEAALLRAGVWLLAQAATLPDTIVTIQAPITPGLFERTQQVLDVVMTFSLAALAVAVIPAAWNFRKSYQKVSDLLDRVYADVNPITHHASRIAENVDYVSTAVRADVQRASAMLTDAERRLQDAIARAEVRARELEALLVVAQEEAEETFVSAASTVRGVRESVRSLREALVDARATATMPDDVLLPDVPDELALVEVRDDAGAATRGRPGPRRAAGPRILDLQAADATAALDPDDDDPFDDYFDALDDEEDSDAELPSPDAPERPRVRPRRRPTD